MAHNKSLYQLKGFWATVLFPIISAGMVWILIFKSIGYPDFLLTKEGFGPKGSDPLYTEFG